MTVELTDRRTFTATVVGSDAPSDLAVLKVDAKGLPTVALGDSDHVRVGDVVLAVGNRGLHPDRRADQSWQLGRSPGEHGRTARRHQLAILSPSGGNLGIGFAIPANMAKHVMDALISDGRVRRGLLGVTVQPLNEVRL